MKAMVPESDRPADPAAPTAAPRHADDPGAFRRAVDNVAGSWRELARSARDVFAAAAAPRIAPAEEARAEGRDLAPRDVAHVRESMRECLQARGGEVAARRRAAALGRTYLGLGESGRLRFLEIMLEFDASSDKIDAAVEHLRRAQQEGGPGSDDYARAARDLRDRLQPPWIQLFRQFNSLPEGVKFLVDLRADLLEFREREPALRRMESDLRELLAAWFDVGFLELRRITWDSPASLLEKLSAYEAVHEIRTWLDLKNRLDVDRRCFAFFHPVMPTEPLIFVEVALVRELSASVAQLLDQSAPVDDPRGASVAIFYSISNCQRGLDGISFGNALIKRVVDELQSEFRGLRTFSTLSPIPGFREWLETRLGPTEERPSLPPAADPPIMVSEPGEPQPTPLQAILRRRNWFRKPEVVTVLRDPLMRICAHYLLEEKRGREGMRARDPVAHFHLSNGARMERLNWAADLSPRGLRESAGMMVNYVYRIDQIDENSVAYLTDGKIAASQQVRALLR